MLSAGAFLGLAESFIPAQATPKLSVVASTADLAAPVVEVSGYRCESE